MVLNRLESLQKLHLHCVIFNIFFSIFLVSWFISFAFTQLVCTTKLWHEFYFFLGWWGKDKLSALSIFIMKFKYMLAFFTLGVFICHNNVITIHATKKYITIAAVVNLSMGPILVTVVHSDLCHIFWELLKVYFITFLHVITVIWHSRLTIQAEC